jgi:uncharacterized protein (DUF1684 family)
MSFRLIALRAWCTSLCLLCVLLSCNRKIEFPVLSTADSLTIVDDNVKHRAAVEMFFKGDPDSPFRRDSSTRFHGIKWFPVNIRYAGRSVLHRYDRAAIVTVMGTKGEERKEMRYGYFEFVIPDDSGAPVLIRLNVYKFTPYDEKRYAMYKDNLMVWFTDKTTGKETYHVGRYVDIGRELPDPSHVYTIDLNKAYNPYCAYSDMYSCAIPRKEDHLDIALRVGEMKYHE